MAMVTDLEGDLKFMDRNSRMIGAFGLDVIAKMVGMKVLIVGCKGIGIEVAKNTVLAGVHTLTIFDPTPTSVRDLGTNFFLTEADVGKPRATACAPRVAELNSNVLVQAAEGGELTEALVAQHTIAVFTRGSRKELTRWNEFCRSQKHPISFMCCYGGGAWGGLFVDHGDSFTIRDATGRAPLIKLVKSIEVKEDHVLVRYDTPDGQPPEGLPDGGLVEFDEVKGLISAGAWAEAGNPSGGSLNNAGPVRTSHASEDPVKTFRISLPTDLSGPPTAWMGGGVITEKKEATTVHFRSFAECVHKPGGVVMAGDGTQGFLMTDMTFSMVELQLHVAQQGVFAFEEASGRLPNINDAADAAQVVALAKQDPPCMQVPTTARRPPFPTGGGARKGVRGGDGCARRHGARGGREHHRARRHALPHRAATHVRLLGRRGRAGACQGGGQVRGLSASDGLGWPRMASDGLGWPLIASGVPLELSSSASLPN